MYVDFQHSLLVWIAIPTCTSSFKSFVHCPVQISRSTIKCLILQQKLNHPQISLLFHIHCFWNKVTGEKERKKMKPNSSMCPGTELAFYPVCPWYVTLGRITVQRCSYIILVLTLVVVEYLLSSTAQQFLQLGMDLELLLPPAFFLVIAKLHGLW